MTTSQAIIVIWRGLLFSFLSIGSVCAFLVTTGCTSPIIEVNRNAPLINVQDSANGNTVPVSAAP